VTTTEPREDVAAMLRDGATYQQIKAKLGASSYTIAATRRAYGIPLPAGPGYRPSPEQRAANEKRTIELLLGGATYREITDEVGISAPTIIAIRRDAGLPAPGHRGTRQPRTVEEGLTGAIEEYGDGHARWVGPVYRRSLQLHAEGRRLNARHVLFEQHHGRPPVGYVRSNCGDQACVAGAHLADDVLRSTTSESPMTVQALTDLLDEIDREGGPEAARTNRLHLLSEGTPMTTAPATPSIVTPPLAAVPQRAGRTASENVPLGQLLQWADTHADEGIRDQAARARATLTGLRRRYDTDKELTELTTEAEQLEQRLAQLRARQDELAPPKSKARRKQPLDYDAATVRSWAKAHSVECPHVGRVPKSVVDAWRSSSTPASPTV
jgi:uncharacterized protein YerC/transposase-like protein